MADKLSLSELQLIIRDSLYLALPEMYWVIAEISEIKENTGGHCYLELIEKQPDEKNVRARVKAIIWAARYRFIKSFFENITGETLREGLKILIKTKIEYHELYGLSLIITDIDPAFTIGDMAMKRQLVIKRLEQEGIFSMNKELEFPLVPQRVAVISSRNAAGYTDFINHLKGNSSGYAIITTLFEAIMQGKDTEDSVTSAFDRIAAQSDLFDLVVIIRGGGSQSDLSWFDSYNISYYITQFPIPVVTGIGHEKDMSVADIVANRSLKTPTAVADLLIDSFETYENILLALLSEIKEVSRTIIEFNRKRVENSSTKLVTNVTVKISLIKTLISGKIIDITSIGKGFIVKAGMAPTNQEARLRSAISSLTAGKNNAIEGAKKRLVNVTINSIILNTSTLEGFGNTLKILSPENVLKRGYTITSHNGKIIKMSGQLKANELIDTQFSDGIIKSRVL